MSVLFFVILVGQYPIKLGALYSTWNHWFIGDMTSVSDLFKEHQSILNTVTFLLKTSKTSTPEVTNSYTENTNAEPSVSMIAHYVTIQDC